MFVLLQVYTVGPDYAHAEARKSPALDGKVERDSEGKEIRYPVMLTAMEKLVARKVCLAFKVSCSFLSFKNEIMNVQERICRLKMFQGFNLFMLILFSNTFYTVANSVWIRPPPSQRPLICV